MSPSGRRPTRRQRVIRRLQRLPLGSIANFELARSHDPFDLVIFVAALRILADRLGKDLSFARRGAILR
jgi:hypothetical protein